MPSLAPDSKMVFFKSPRFADLLWYKLASYKFVLSKLCLGSSPAQDHSEGSSINSGAWKAAL